MITTAELFSAPKSYRAGNKKAARRGGWEAREEERLGRS